MRLQTFLKQLVLMGGLLASASSPAFAWSASGHRQIGTLAYPLLTPHAKREVDRLISNYSLAQMAVWADCAKEVGRSAASSYVYAPGSYAAKECFVFAKDREQTNMIIRFERANWNICDVDKKRGCAPQFHFINLPIDGPGYLPPVGGTFAVGQHPYDIVQVVRAAIVELETPGDASNTPFNFTDGDALKLVVHLLGDLSQPLHVGSVFLDLDGKAVANAALSPSVERRFGTAGGNALMLPSKSLHTTWDNPLSDVLSVPPSTPLMGRPEDWIIGYASDTFAQAKLAFDGLTFGRAVKGAWAVQLPNGLDYNARVRPIQERQIARAARNLADVLNTIWPGA